jgi:hypothetical protein
MMDDYRKRWTAEQWGQCLVDHVSTVTQLDPDKNELANTDDWRRCAIALFNQLIRQRDGHQCARRKATKTDR